MYCSTAWPLSLSVAPVYTIPIVSNYYIYSGFSTLDSQVEIPCSPLVSTHQLHLTGSCWFLWSRTTHTTLITVTPLPLQALFTASYSPLSTLHAGSLHIDDIVIFSQSFGEHGDHLDQVFKAISRSGLTLSPNKCFVGYQSLLLLGQKVSRLGVSTHKEKVDAILQLEPPTNVPTLQTFLGMMTYFSSYIPFYAWIVEPLFSSLKKKTVWQWTHLEQHAFELAKTALAAAPVMAYPVWGMPDRLYSDACDFGLAAILQQVQQVQIKDLRGTKIYDKLKRHLIQTRKFHF